MSSFLTAGRLALLAPTSLTGGPLLLLRHARR